MPKRLNSKFYTTEVLDAAPKLLGKLLARRLENGEILRFRITETEAYCGEEDTACTQKREKRAVRQCFMKKGV
jgi:DNA-3-methyladenine glycosylase